MSDMESELRRALRPVDAPPGFTARVMRALPSQRPPATVTPLPIARHTPRANAWRRLSTPMALAASLVVAVLLGQHMAFERAQREQRAGLEASRELMQALRVTSQKLDAAYQAVQSAPAGAQDDEENRS